MKKILCLTLLICLLLPAVISCKKNNEQPSADSTLGSDTATTTTTPSGEGQTDDPMNKYNVYDEIGNRDFGGRDIIIATSDYTNFIQEVKVDGYTGDIVNDALFTRNATVERRLNCNIEQLTVSSGGLDTYKIGQYVVTQMQSGLHEYDLALASTYSNIIRTVDNAWVDLRTCPNINFTKNYWSQLYNEQISIGGSQYMVTGAASLSFYREIYVTFMNETMLKNGIDAPDIFQVIKDGKWTIEYQKQLASKYYDDTNGNGKDEFDTFGFVVNSYDGVDPYWSSCEISMISKNASNLYELDLDRERLSNTADLLIDLFTSEGAWADRSHKLEGFATEVFAQERALMTTARLVSVEDVALREMTDTYLVLPVARYSEDQDEYYSFLHDTFLSYAVPNTCPSEEDLDEITAFLEVLASESYRSVTPAYYEMALKAKYVSAPETVELLDYITQHVYIDAGVVYNKMLFEMPMKIRDIVNEATTLGTGNTVSSTYNDIYVSNLSQCVKDINDRIQALQFN